MDWYKTSQEHNDAFDPDIANYIFIEDVEDMAQRIFNQNREWMKEEGYKTWKEWIDDHDAYNVSLSFDSDTIIQDLYFGNLPNELYPIDAVEAYKRGILKHKGYTPHQQEKVDLSDSGKYESKVPWHYKKKKYSKDDLVKNFSIAKSRVVKSNADQIYEARKIIFLAFNGQKNLAEILGISDSELRKVVRMWSGLSKDVLDTQEKINSGVGEEHQWSGFQNTSFLNIRKISHEDVDKFVKQIIVPTTEGDSYRSLQGEYLRKIIMNSFLAIDTGLSYSDLSFVIKKLEPGFGKNNVPRGRYVPQENAIHIGEVGGGTVAHEIGHYLDYKFAREVGSLSDIGLSESSTPGGDSMERSNWVKRYKNFIRSLALKGDIGSEYYQQPTEVFARFIAKFVSWVSNHGKLIQNYDNYTKDKFGNSDFVQFIKLLQEKSYLEKHFPMKRKV